MLGLQILQLRDNVNKMSLSKSWAEFLLCFFISTDWTDVEKLNSQVVYTEYICCAVMILIVYLQEIPRSQ